VKYPAVNAVAMEMTFGGGLAGVHQGTLRESRSGFGSSWRGQRLEPGLARSLPAQEVFRLMWQALAAWAEKSSGKK
jgi:hypothetical protein